MRTDDLDYDLPPEAVAQHPVEPRDAARLLVDRGPDRPPDHRTVADLPDLLAPGDLVVVNDTRVLHARLLLRKPTGGRVEVLLLEPRPELAGWEALVRPGRRVAPGTVLALDDGRPAVEVGDDLGEGRRLVHLRLGPDGDRGGIDPAALEEVGEVPLPPYIHEPLADPERYQTVYADRPGSVAAPTAGLHLTDEVLRRCVQRGARIERVELQVGLGTFQPIGTAQVAQHRMHAERYRVAPEVLEAVAGAERVVAIGTTSVRALESAARYGAGEGRTELFLHGDEPFLAVDVLLTNFHVPRSSLLALVEAFIGPRWRDLYAEALSGGYRFLSFGDAMLLTGRRPRAGRGGGAGA